MKFELHSLEPRLLLSADGVAGTAEMASPPVAQTQIVETVDETPVDADPSSNLLDGLPEVTIAVDTTAEPAGNDANAPVVEEDPVLSQPIILSNSTEMMVETLLAPLPPPGETTVPSDGLMQVPTDENSSLLPLADKGDISVIQEEGDKGEGAIGPTVQSLGFLAPLVLEMDIITAGTDIRIEEDVVLGQNLTILLSTGNGGGDITIEGSVNGNAGQAPEHLVINAGTGNVRIEGNIGDFVPLGSLTVQSAGTVSLHGVVRTIGDFIIEDSTGTILVSQPLNPGDPEGAVLAGAIDINTQSQVTFFGDVETITGDLQLTAPIDSGNVEFRGNVDVANDLVIHTAFETRFSGEVSVAGTLQQIQSDGSTRFDFDVRAGEADLAAQSFNFDGAVTIGSTGNIRVSGNEVNFKGGANSVSSLGAGSQTLEIRAYEPIIKTRLGSVASVDLPNILDVGPTDLAAISSTFGEVKLGWEAPGIAGSGEIEIGTSVLNSSLSVFGTNILATGDLSGPGPIRLNAQTGNVEFDGGATVTVTEPPHSLFVTALNDILLSNGSLNAATSIDLTATQGSIEQPEGVGLITTQNLHVSAGGSVDLNTQVDFINGSSSISGNVEITEQDDLNLTGVSTLDGSISITVLDGSLTVVDPGTGVTAGGIGAVHLEAQKILAVNADVRIQQQVSTAAGSITVIAADNVMQSANGDIRILTGANNVSVTAETGGILMDGAASTTVDTGSITYAAEQDIEVALLEASESTAGSEVNLDSESGNIVDVNGPLINVVGYRLTADAAGDVDLDTSVREADVSSQSMGMINLDEANGIDLVDLATADGLIAVVAGGLITATKVDSSGNDQGANTIDLTSTGANIAVVTITAGLLNDVNLNAAGAITNDGNPATKISANLLTIISMVSIDVDTAAASIDAESNLAGSILITEMDDVLLQRVHSANGPITVVAGAQIVAADVHSMATNNDTSDIELRSNSAGIEVQLVQAEAMNDISLFAEMGAVTQDADPAIDVVADQLLVRSQNGIDLDTTIVTLDLITTGLGKVVIDESDALELIQVITGDGSISIDADQEIIAHLVDSSATGSNTNNIALTSANSRIEVDLIDAGAMNNVTLSALNGAVVHDGDGAVDVIADLLTVVAAEAIDLDTEVVSAIASSLATGNILLDEASAIQLLDLDTNNGSITIRAVDQIVAVDVDSSHTLAPGNPILLRSFNAGIEAGNINRSATNDLANDVTLDAMGGPITQDGDTLVDVQADHFQADALGGIDIDTRINTIDASSTGTGNIRIAELNDIELTDVDTEDGSVFVSAGRQITAVDVDTSATLVDGDITLISAAGIGATINVHFVNAGTTNNVIINAQGDAVLQDGDPGADVIASDLTVDAAGEINLDTRVMNADLSTHAAGIITINETDDINLVDIDTFNGAIQVIAAGQVSALDVDSSATDSATNTIMITSTLAGIDVNLVNAGAEADAMLTAGGGAISQDGDDEIDLISKDLQASAAGLIDLDTLLETLTANAASSITIDEANSITLTQVLSANGFISIDARGQIVAIHVDTTTTDNDLNDIQINSLEAGIDVHLIQAGTMNDVALSAGGGPIIQDGDGDPDVVADVLTADATGEINLDTTVTRIDASADAAGDILINETDDVILADVDTANGKITVVAAGIIQAIDVTSMMADTDDNDITLTSTTAGIVVDLIQAGRANDVFLNALSGSIVQDGDAETDLLADQLVADAQGEINLDTNVHRLDATSTHAGDIVIKETDAIILEEIDTANGGITVVAGGNISAVDVNSALTDDDTNDVSLTSTAGAITVDRIVAGSNNDVVLAAFGGAIRQDGDLDVDVIADVLSADAAGGIDLDTTVQAFDARTTDTGQVRINETDAITLTEISTADGAVHVEAGGDIAAISIKTTSVPNAFNEVSLTTIGGGIEVGLIDATGDNNVTLDAQGGSVIQTVDPDTDVIAGVLMVDANGEINLDTAVAALDASANAPGDVVIKEVDDISLTNITTVDGAIDVVAGGSIVAERVRSDDGPVTLDAGDFLVAADVYTQNGHINLTAAGLLTAAMVDSSATDNDLNDITLLSTGGGVQVGSVTAGNNNDVILNAQGGAITDDGLPATFLKANLLTADALGGIELDTEVNEVDASALAIGEIVLRERDDIILRDVDTVAGQIIVVAEGQITAGDVDSSARDNDFSDITLTSNGAGIVVQSIVAGNENDVLLEALGGAITQEPGADITADRLEAFAFGSITLDTTVHSVIATTAADGAISLHETDDIVLTEVATFNGPVDVTAGGQITAVDVRSDGEDDPANTIELVSTGGGIEVQSVIAGSTADVTLEAGAGAITQDGDTASDVVGNDLLATATSGIDLDTTVDTVIAEVTNTGDLVLDETDDVVLTDLSTADGAITVAAGGQITAVNVDSSAMGVAANDISITSTGSGIEVQTVHAGAMNDVVLDAQAGSITRDDTILTNVVGDELVADAAGGISLGTQVASIDASTHAPGSISIFEVDEVILTDVDTSNGAIHIEAGGEIQALDVDSSSTDEDLNDILLRSVNAGIFVDWINAGEQNDIMLHADGGPITQDGDADVDVRADSLFARAQGGIDLDTELASLDAVTDGPGAIVIDEVDGIELSNVETQDGSIEVTAGGLIQVNHVNSSNTDSDQNDITITSSGADILITPSGLHDGVIDAGSQGDVTLSAAGSVSDDGDATADIIADSLSITAGGAVTVDTTVATANIVTAAAGSVTLDETDDIILTTIETAAGEIEVTAGGQITAVNLDSSATDDGTNGISLTSTGAGIEVQLVDAGTLNDVTFDAQAGAITQDGDGEVDVIGHALDATATAGIDLDTQLERLAATSTVSGDIGIDELDALVLDPVTTADGSVTINAGGALVATNVDSSNTDDGSNNIQLTSTGSSIEIGSVLAGDLNNVILDAQGGAIIDDGLATTFLMANLLTADALGGIELDTEVNEVDASALAIGEIVLRERDDIILSDVDTVAGQIIVVAEGQITAVDVDSSTSDNDFNDITLTSNGAGIVVQSIVAGNENDVVLEALGGAITQGAGAGITADRLEALAFGSITLDTTVHSVIATTTADGAISLHETDDIVLTEVATFNGPVEVTAGGQITAVDVRSDGEDDPANTIELVSTGGGIEVQSVIAGSTADVTLDAGAGAITQDGDTASDVVGNDLLATATSGIDLDTTVDTVIAQVTGTGDLVLDETDDVVLSDLSTADGAITVTAGGQITAVNVDSSAMGAAANDISITSTGGGIEVQTVHAGPMNDVVLDAQAGPISQGPGAGVIGDALLATAGGDITLSTTVESVIATTSAAGDIVLTETDDITVTEARTQNGSITLIAEGQITVEGADSSETLSEANDVILVSNTAGMQTNGPVNSGDDVLLMAVGDISVDASVQAAGAVTLLSKADVTQNGMVMAADSVEVLALSGAIAMDASTITMAPVIRYHAYNTVTLGTLDTRTAADKAAGTVLDQANWGGIAVESRQGSIVSAAGVADANIYASELQLRAPNGDVGGFPNMPIVTEVIRLAGWSGGAFNVNDASALEIGEVAGLSFDRLLTLGISTPITSVGAPGIQAGGSLVITANTSLIVSKSVDTGGNALLKTETPGSDIFIDDSVSTQTGDLSILSAGAIQQSSEISAGVSSLGQTIDLQAANGSITMSPGTTTRVSGGHIRLDAQRGVELGLMDTRTLVDRIVNLNDDQATWGDIAISAGDAIMESAPGAGIVLAANNLSIELTDDRLGFEAGGIVMPLPVEVRIFAGSGISNVALDDVSGMIIGETANAMVHRVQQSDGSVAPVNIGGISSVTGAATIHLRAGADDLIIENDLIAEEVIMLENVGADGRIVINASVVSSRAHLTVSAEGDVVQSADLVSGGGTVLVQSLQGALIMTEGARTLTDGGHIRIAARGDILLEWIDARTNAERNAGTKLDQAVWGQVSIVSAASSIFDIDPVGDNEVDVWGSAVRLTAAGEIGVYGLLANPIEVDALSASANAPQGINVTGEYDPAIVDPVRVQQVRFDGLNPVQDDDVSRFFTHIHSDFDGDGRADVQVFNQENGEWTIRYSSTGEIVNFVWGRGGNAYAVRGELSEDGKSDPVVYQRTFLDRVELLGGEIPEILADPDVPPAFQEKFPDDNRFVLSVMLGDVSGDGAQDMIGYNRETGLWTTIDVSTGLLQTFDLGMPAAQAMIGDFDGDGLTDIGQYHGGVFTARLTGDGSLMTESDVGGDGWVALIDDYTGDGVDDFTAYNPTTGEWQLRNSQTQAIETITWMGPGLLPTNGDFDEDGKSDLAVFDPNTGEWFIRSSSTQSLLLLDPGSTTHSFVLGSATELPVNDVLSQDIVIEIFDNL